MGIDRHSSTLVAGHTRISSVLSVLWAITFCLSAPPLILVALPVYVSVLPATIPDMPAALGEFAMWSAKLWVPTAQILVTVSTLIYGYWTFVASRVFNAPGNHRTFVRVLVSVFSLVPFFGHLVPLAIARLITQNPSLTTTKKKRVSRSLTLWILPSCLAVSAMFVTWFLPTVFGFRILSTIGPQVPMAQWFLCWSLAVVGFCVFMWQQRSLFGSTYLPEVFR